MIVITATVEVEPRHWDEARALADRHCATSRDEPGCLSHQWYPHPGRAHTLFFYEEWADRAAIDVHFAQPGSLELVRSLRSWARGEVALRMCPAGEAEMLVLRPASAGEGEPR